MRPPRFPVLALAAAAAAAAGVVAAPGALATLTRTGEAEAPKRLAAHMVARSVLRMYDTYNDVWGYTAPDGREYALVGTRIGVSVVNITDREAPYETGFFGGPTSTWRDIKTFRTTMYIVNDTEGGMQIVSLDDPEHPRAVAAYLGIRRAHNLYVDAEQHTLYVAGSNTHNGGVIALWLSDPESPRPRYIWSERYAHDVHARGDRLYIPAINHARLEILEVGREGAGTLTPLGIISNYPAAKTHAVWPTKDDRHVITVDETPGAFTRIWNVEHLPAVDEVASYRPLDSTTSIPHTVFVDGDLAFLSYYTAGVRVLDITDPAAPEEVAFYDTRPGDEGPSFSGCWGVYPFFRRSPGLVVASDVERGLFVLQLAPALAAKEGDLIGPGAEGAVRAEAPRAVAAAPRVGASYATTVDIVDVTGRRVRRLQGADATDPARTWDRRDDTGGAVAAGVYFVADPRGATRPTRRIVVVR